MAAAPESRPTDVLGVLRAAEKFLRERGSPSARLDAELLLASALGKDRLGLYLVFDRPMDAAELQRCRELIARRARGEPVAYLTGTREFWGLNLQVTPDVLIPRPETELLVERAVALAAPGARVVDLGTGSGAIALALASERPDLELVATDVSPAALAVARANASRLGLAERVRFGEGSWWQALGADTTFDLVVSNPPYVDPQRPELIAPAVRQHEPSLALFAERGDPLSAYRAIAAELDRRLRPGGHVLLEAGADTVASAAALLGACAGLGPVETVADLAGIPRVLVARRAERETAAL